MADTAKIRTKGSELQLGDSASPEVFTKVGQVTSITGPDGTAGEIDVSDLGSTAREYLQALADEGNVNAEMIWDPANTQHQELQTLFGNGNKRNWKIKIPTSPAYFMSFNGFVSSFAKTGETDDVWRASLTVRISGSVTVATS